MAAPDVEKVQGATGRLVLNPSNLSLSFPYGGTALGLVANVALMPIERRFLNTAEEYGGMVVEEYDMGRDWLMSCSVRGFDAALLNFMFPNVTSGGVTETLTQNRGAAMSARSGVLLFAPRDSTHYGFILYRALPRVKESGRMPFSVHERTSFAAIFRAIPDSAGRDINLDVFTSLTL